MLPMMQIRPVLITGFMVAANWLGVGQESVSYAQQLDSAWLQEKLDVLRHDLDLVGAGATVVVDGSAVASAVSGTRRQSSDVGVTLDDQWHVGSITKSMTATVIARLVEQGQLSWDSPLPDLLPATFDKIDPSWSKVTLVHLLNHTAGLPANFPALAQFERPTDPDELHAARQRHLLKVLSSAAQSAPGQKMAYSNVGYTLAGWIAAEKAKTGWEQLMQQQLFEPLNLSTAGFGPPRGTQPLDQPWGHRRNLFMRTPAPPDGLADNTPIMGPAGTVHMSMADLGRYGWMHLQGETQDSSFLKSVTFQKLHQGGIGHYACGWVDQHKDWADGRILWHNGSNTMWYALMVLVPSRNAVVVVVTNDGYLEKADPAFMQLAEQITTKLPKR